jgi:hypothetical protein
MRFEHFMEDIDMPVDYEIRLARFERLGRMRRL